MNKIKTALFALLLVLMPVFLTTQVLVIPVAAETIDCPDGSQLEGDDGFTARDCPPANDCDVGPGDDLDSDNCAIIDYLVRAINILSAVAGMAIVASIMIAGFQYMTARDNSGQIEAARKRIVWAIVALLVFIFTYAFLNFIVPGGVV